MTTQVFVASTAFGLATLVSAVDDGAFPAVDRRILVLSNNAPVPETAHRIADVAGYSALVHKFAAVYDYNEAIAPQHPSMWRPRAADLPMLHRYLAALWSLSDDDVHLVVESIQVSPAVTLCQIFPDARIDVYADGLMSYGPTRNGLPGLVASRVERLLHLDLVPGLTPVLLTELDVAPTRISVDSFLKTIASLGPPAPQMLRSAGHRQVAVLLGQYLSGIGILSSEEETELHKGMVRGAVSAGFQQVIFKTHPTANPALAEPLVAEAEGLGASLVVSDGSELVETWFRSENVGLVVGCFSTALMTAATLYGLPTARVGTEVLLERLRPYENSNRVPVTIIDATLPDISTCAAFPATPQPQSVDRPGPNLQQLVAAVSYCMQPGRYPALREPTEALLLSRWHDLRPYFKRRRLTALDLPGRLPERALIVPRPVRAVVRRTLGPTISDQVSKAIRKTQQSPTFERHLPMTTQLREVSG